uniref:Uncharacterized protein n=1 Tax=Kalanchoe fedtschenkoi TaxID=63787 RepID=A0A7N0TTX0_KALFE
MMNKNSNLGSSSVNKSETAFSLGDYDEGKDMQEEESGWTAYFDDYFSNKTPYPPASDHMDGTYDDEEEGCHGGSGSMLCSLQSPSMVSDAASFAAWKSQYKNSDGRSAARAETLAACSSFDGTQMVIHKKLRFKTTNRHKRFGDYYDDSLEDTASSPVNSPKAKGDYAYDHQQARDGLKQQVEEVKVYGDAYRSLKEKGLCLVPYSVLINYIG